MKFLKHYDKERMKMAILKHEETFRQQVHELHRLYRVQKLLTSDMKDIKLKRQKDLACPKANLSMGNGEHGTGSCQPRYNNHHQRRPRRPLNLELPAEEYIENAEEDVMLEIEQESDIELTLAIRSRRSERDGTPGTSFNSSSTESSGVKSRGHEWGLSQAPDINLSFPYERNSSFNVGEGMRQDGVKQQPPWLFQCLSLKMA
ncbi:uncharacterized protein [Elaeis guineensis]|uniref:Uncharacterized protein LOC105033253 n=1 Tax=Elaeis guineensis var. tenera TaxID=51953 RepID=A0A6J0PBN0_ELAGV|nr:uncharacterized protein LOC105033253 [Elaeis guineensis]XP_010906275.1 uncharacterized protein LOC105033253 [Elaeis guineensis]XP_019702155.1 uncharacterized protein LOC105033253 [Elaeis guineensis]